ncbi:MAG: HEAT repeat domain-containing protein [Candidatus Latescibacterota bacterium]
MLTEVLVRTVNLGVLTLLLTGCGQSIERSIDDLATGGEAGSRAAQELLLLKPNRAVGPLLEAMDDPQRAKAHLQVADVLVGLVGRVEQDRLRPGLERHLTTHPNPEVRRRIAERLGRRRRHHYAGALLAAVQDTEIEVRYAAFKTLVNLWDRLAPEQRVQLDSLARQWATTEHEGLRVEVELRLEGQADVLLRSANQAVIEARIADAGELFEEAITLLPNSWKTRFGLARFHLQNGDPEHGFELLDQLGAVLRVSRGQGAPVVDGRLDEPFWERTAQAPLAVKGYWGYFAAAQMEARVNIAYTDEALYVGLYNDDSAPDKLVVTRTTRDDQVWLEDSVELFFDSNEDRNSYVQVIVSAAGTMFDAVHTDGIFTQERDWNGDYRVATYVGDDFWSVEIRLAYDKTWIKRPKTGDRWAANFCRNFRDGEQSVQWVYTGGDFHRLSDFGFLVFR